MKRPKSLINGEPWILESGVATNHVCCDCGLEHVMLVEVKRNKVYLSFYRDDYQTKKNKEDKWKKNYS